MRLCSVYLSGRSWRCCNTCCIKHRFWWVPRLVHTRSFSGSLAASMQVQISMYARTPHLYMGVDISTNKHLYIYMYTYVFLYVSINIHTCVYTYIFIYICLCIRAEPLKEGKELCASWGSRSSTVRTASSCCVLVVKSLAAPHPVQHCWAAARPLTHCEGCSRGPSTHRAKKC